MNKGKKGFVFKKRVCAALTVLAAVIAALGGAVTSCASENASKWPEAPAIKSDYGCLMDAESGAVLFDKNKDVAMPPASLTKIMTTLLALENGDPDSQMTMTETGVAYAVDGSSNLYTQVGEVITLKDALYGVMLKSANDMATQVGEFIGGGSLETFISMMNARADELGCLHTHFSNACGMPADDHMTTAYDLCLIAREALKNDTFREIISTSSYTIPATNLIAAREIGGHHPFMNGTAAPYDGFIGGKTGYTDAALNTLATFAQRDGRTLIAVTLHGAGTDVTASDARALLDYGFNNFTNVSAQGVAEGSSGGVITLPVGADVSEVTHEVRDTTDASGSRAVLTSYTYEGHSVGSSVLSPEVMKAIEEKEKAAEDRRRTEEETKAAAYVGIGSGTSGGAGNIPHLSGADGTYEQADYLAGEPSTIGGGDDKVSLPFGISMGRTAFIAIAALTILILLGLLIIIITLIGRSSVSDSEEE